MHAIQVCLAASLVTAVALPAQQDTSSDQRSFRTISIGGAAAMQRTDARLGDLYKPRTGGLLELATPLGVGQADLRVMRIPYHATRDTPDFDATIGAVGWRLGVLNVGPATLSIGAQTGVMQFSFHDSNIDPGLRAERELLMAGEARGDVRLGRASFFASGSYAHVWLHVPMHVATFIAGVDYVAATPAWLREFLR